MHGSAKRAGLASLPALKRPSSKEYGNMTTANWNVQTVALALIFFASMIVMEVLTEGTFNQYRNAGNILPSSVTFFQFLFCFSLPLAMSPAAVSTIPTSPRAIWPYVKLSALVFGATALATAALNYVPYSVKIVFKSAKLIPTMMVSSCMHKVIYSYREYIAALFLCLGAIGYGYDPGKSSVVTAEYQYLGVLILTISAFCDALVPNIQQDMMKLNNTPAEELMVNTNVVGLVCATCYMIVTGDFTQLVKIGKESPELLANLSGIGCSLAVAVMCYTTLIKKAGSVAAVSIGTIRKIVTIGLSYILFPKELLPIHMVSSVCVVIGIVLEACKKHKGNTSPTEAEKESKIALLAKSGKRSTGELTNGNNNHEV